MQLLLFNNFITIYETSWTLSFAPVQVEITFFLPYKGMHFTNTHASYLNVIHWLWSSSADTTLITIDRVFNFTTQLRVLIEIL